MVAELIELMTPLKYAAEGLRFLDYSLDAASVGDNCKRIAESKGQEAWYMIDRFGRRRAPTSGDVLAASSVAITDLGGIMRSHRDFMIGLHGAKP